MKKGNNKDLDFKNEFILSIKEAEKQAIDLAEYELKFDLHQIKEQAINKSHFGELLTNLITKIYNKYGGMSNYYKNSLEQFNFLNDEIVAEGGQSLNEEDRIDFIAMILSSTLESIIAEADSGAKATIEAYNTLKQLQNIEDIILTTKVLELKYKTFQVMLKKYSNEEELANNEEVKTDEPTSNETGTKELVCLEFSAIDVNDGWSYAFSSESDYNKFTNLLVSFFELKSFDLPNEAIKLNRGTKTRVAKVLGELHKKLSNRDNLTEDTSYFDLVRVLHAFENENNDKIYKSLTR